MREVIHVQVETEVEALDTIYLQFVMLPFYSSLIESRALHMSNGNATLNNPLFSSTVHLMSIFSTVK